MRVLAAEDVRRALGMRHAIGAAREGLLALSTGAARVPHRLSVPVPGRRGVALVMPASVEPAGLGLKAVTVLPGNPARGLPLIHAAMLLIDPRDGRFEALVEGSSLTALRTGAAGGLACDLLARPDAAVAAVFGTGVQARSQLEGAAAVRTLREVRVVGRRRDALEAFAAWARSGVVPGAHVSVASDPEEALHGAEIVITATTSRTPLFDGRLVESGAHVTAVGAFEPDARELDSALVGAARLFVDTREGALAEAGDLLIPIGEGLVDPAAIAEVGEVAAGLRPGRTGPDEITVFKSVGTAVLDLAVGGAVLRAAAAAGLGSVLDLGG